MEINYQIKGRFSSYKKLIYFVYTSLYKRLIYFIYTCCLYLLSHDMTTYNWLTEIYNLK